jgi:hypothetical protein
VVLIVCQVLGINYGAVVFWYWTIILSLASLCFTLRDLPNQSNHLENCTASSRAHNSIVHFFLFGIHLKTSLWVLCTESIGFLLVGFFPQEDVRVWLGSGSGIGLGLELCLDLRLWISILALDLGSILGFTFGCYIGMGLALQLDLDFRFTAMLRNR